MVAMGLASVRRLDVVLSNWGTKTDSNLSGEWFCRDIKRKVHLRLKFLYKKRENADALNVILDN